MIFIACFLVLWCFLADTFFFTYLLDLDFFLVIDATFFFVTSTKLEEELPLDPAAGFFSDFSWLITFLYPGWT